MFKKDYITTMILAFTIATLTITLFETTKNVHADSYKKIGNNIKSYAGRAPAVKQWRK